MTAAHWALVGRIVGVTVQVNLTVTAEPVGQVWGKLDIPGSQRCYLGLDCIVAARWHVITGCFMLY